MPQRTETIEMTQAEFDEAIERAGRYGAQTVIKRFRGLLESQLSGRGIVSRQMIAAAYEVSTDTVERWEARHDWSRVDGPNRRRIYYHWPDVVDSVKAELSND